MKKLALLLLSLLLLSGCASMPFFAEYQLSKTRTKDMAERNAAINLALIRGHLTHSDVDELLYYMVNLIEISSRFDKDYYKEIYDFAWQQNIGGDQDALKAAVTQFKESGNLAAVTKDYAKQYQQAAQFLANQRQRDAAALASVAVNMSAIANSTDPMRFNHIGIPGVEFMPDAKVQPLPSNLLVNTSGGIQQCKVTKNGFVFCF